MRALLATTALWAISGWPSTVVEAAQVEAGTLTTVVVDAPLYDSRLGTDGGCDPAGCTGDNTRGDSRTRTMEIYVDGALQTSWTSSGTTTSFESVNLGVTGQTIELRGVLDDTEWLSIMEVRFFEVYLNARTYRPVSRTPPVVWRRYSSTIGLKAGAPPRRASQHSSESPRLPCEGASSLRPPHTIIARSRNLFSQVEIMIDDGTTTPYEVEASDLGPVTAESAVFDTRLAVDGGCDPAGCTADNTRDGDMDGASRWSCAPQLGGACSIVYDFGAEYDLSRLRLAMYKGTERQVTAEISVDGVLITTWTSSGSTDGFEDIDMSGISGQEIEITGVLDDSEWLSIIETRMFAAVHTRLRWPLPTPSLDAWTLAALDYERYREDCFVRREQLKRQQQRGGKFIAGTVSTVTATAALYDTSLADDNGCDPSGCTADLTRDGDLSTTSRWSCSPQLGGACTISYDLGGVFDISELNLAMYKGSERQVTAEVYVDEVLITTWTSSGTTDDFESIDLSGSSGQLIGVTGVLADSEWLSIVETEIMVLTDDVITPTPTPPGPTPAPVTPTGDLQPVGLLPLATTGGTELLRYYAKDGDTSTSWTCSGDPREDDESSYDCNLYFNMVYYRHIKQVKIALPDGADRTVGMRIATTYYDDDMEVFVTSSGTTDGFETYDFDYFTDRISIAGVFTSTGETISISEVEFVEEVQEGEVPVADFNTPYDNGDGLWIGPTTDAFEWSSESDEAIDRTLSFDLAYYAIVDTVELQFPTGETYNFELWLYGDDGEPGYTLTVRTELSSMDAEGWQSFDISASQDEVAYLTQIAIVMKGTGSGAPGFKLSNARFLGTTIDNPTDTLYVGSTYIDSWEGDMYPDFVAEGTGDQQAIMAAICAVKKASFDGVDCIGGDDAATGTVSLPMGEWHVNGNIFMKSGVLLNGRYSIDDSPYTTDIQLEEDAAGNTDIGAIVVMDGISDARIDDLWIRGLYDPDTSNDIPAVSGLGSTGLSIVGSTNITCLDTEIRFIDGDALVVRDSETINIDAGGYDDEYLPWTIGRSRGTGLVVDSSDAIWIRRHTLYDNGVAGIHITGSNNFTFEATIASECWGDDCVIEGEGSVGSLDGQQPIEVIVESSTLVKFDDMKVESVNDPVMTISGSTAVSFNNCGFSNVASGTCVIQTDALSDVTIGDDPELSLEDSCYIKV
ncbi:unnamed protein product [Scytosiphon promiscuus]